jgi:hypothetical protein
LMLLRLLSFVIVVDCCFYMLRLHQTKRATELVTCVTCGEESLRVLYTAAGTENSFCCKWYLAPCNWLSLSIVCKQIIMPRFIHKCCFAAPTADVVHSIHFTTHIGLQNQLIVSVIRQPHNNNNGNNNLHEVQSSIAIEV